MYISIDGGDGSGKSTLAQKLADFYKFYYLKKPIDEFIGVKTSPSLRSHLSSFTQKCVYDLNKSEKIKVAFNSSLLLHYKKLYEDKDTVVDRGLLSCFLFNGSDETTPIFDSYIKKGLSFGVHPK